MKNIVFDTGGIITLATNDLLWTLEKLKNKYNGDFCIPHSVKYELVDKPLGIKKFKLEAIMVNQLILDGVLDVHDPLNVDELLELVNNIFSSKGKNIHILDRAEVEAMSLVLRLKADAYVVDERTMRMLIEDPKSLHKLLERKLHIKIQIDNKKVKEFRQIVKGVKIIRSSELMLIAYELGLFNHLISKEHDSSDLLDGLLWGLRLRGCGMSTDEINKIIKFESKIK